jgi:hypothetical protein
MAFKTLIDSDLKTLQQTLIVSPDTMDQSLEAARNRGCTRREALRMCLAAGAGAALFGVVKSRRVEAKPVLATLFAGLVVNFVRNAFERVVHNALAPRIQQADNAGHVVPRPPRANPTFHQRFEPRYHFQVPMRPVFHDPTRARFPVGWCSIPQVVHYAVDQALPVTNELNNQEMNQLAAEDEITQYGCVLFPCSANRGGLRRQVQNADLVQQDYGFNVVCREDYGQNPANYRVEYMRDFEEDRPANQRKRFRAYGALDGMNRPKLMISSFEL